MTQTTDHGWTVSGRGYKSAIDMGAPSCAEVIGPNHAANARLMAAAPDLLAALENMTAHYRFWMSEVQGQRIDREAISIAQAAMNKARGA